jgi:hypothetical protein
MHPKPLTHNTLFYGDSGTFKQAPKATRSEGKQGEMGF